MAETAAVGGSTPRTKNVRGLRTRQKLIDSAGACFAEYGYSATRIADIVHRAGVSQGNFYRHFESKQQVFLDALRPGLDELLASTRGLSSEDPLELSAMTERMNAYLVTYTQHRHLLRVMREAAAIRPDDGFLELWLDTRAAFVARTTRWLQRLKAQGQVGDVDLAALADVLGSAVEQTAYVHIGLAEQAPRPEDVKRLARTLAWTWHHAIRGT